MSIEPVASLPLAPSAEPAPASHDVLSAPPTLAATAARQESAQDEFVLRALEGAQVHWRRQFGSGSIQELTNAYLQAAIELCAGRDLASAEAAAFSQQTPESLVQATVAAHVRRYGRAALEAEFRDERERNAAATDDTALVRYQRSWERKLARLARRHPARWHVPGLSDEEVLDALTLRLIEAVRTEPGAWQQYCRAGKEWSLQVAQTQLAQLRKSFRLAATPVDFNSTLAFERGANQEERWLEIEAASCRSLARQNAEQQLSSSQRRWLSAMQAAATRGDFFQDSEQLNLSATSRILAKHRSSAQRAYKELQAYFQRELTRLE